MIAGQFEDNDPIDWFKLNYQSLDRVQFGLALIELYISLWITIIGTSWATRRVIIYIRTNVPQAGQVADRLKYYPMILLVSWIFPTIQLFICLILKQNIMWMEDISIVFHCSQGFFYSLLFFTTDSVKTNPKPRTSTIVPSGPRQRVSTMDLTLETIKRLETAE